ncbi:class I SAM-dependent methyltransferase [Gorillibacterium timonense]|uniref:class I SAM-dependent methyltransferase n=1 Tax=Gorillibacterium timonense TaxID=1689269 RepID=UPI00071CB236|nr:class I SAM-dependent methyltransferase [Gorillibacterium timonense]
MEIHQLLAAAAKPAIFQKGTAQMWTDDHISQQMLLAHLDPGTDAASRNLQTIDRSAAWIHRDICQENTSLKILDLGCGPGLYTNRLAELGYEVTGIDFSARSIRHAKEQAAETGLSVRYLNEDYLSCLLPDSYDLILMIYCDFGVFDEEERRAILGKVHAALAPNGKFLFDMFQPVRYRNHSDSRSWYVENGGFWRKDPYLCLESSSWDEKAGIHLDSYTILEEGRSVETYHLWDKTYIPDELTSLLQQNGFGKAEFYGDVTGSPYRNESDTLCAVASRE